MLIYADASDAVARASVERAARQSNIELTSDPGIAEVLLLPLSEEADLVSITEVRSQNPRATLIAHTMVQKQDLWTAAERAGADRIENSGGLGVLLRRLVKEFESGSQRPRMVSLCSVGDVAGRLGILACVQHELGELILIKGQGRPVCLVGPCPHAGGSLGSAVIEDGVMTCPVHGSQFSIDTGERTRGPADEGLQQLRVVEEDGKYWVVAAPGV
ncbi:Rieske (2Fe-2S) protein [Ferrimicrobium sp.]|uniref:Rieske (2Fe-2S) protein n=1 Tax=Ferrimicrobium sp. TaxID=2926050 RepID=UPI00260DB9D5|nr:Rieske (2Fe-2S) protein [Ferrimicrobium sp.]